MRFSSFQVVFQEIPNEISLAFQIVGCPLRCIGCHSSDLWNSHAGNEMNPTHLAALLEKYRNYITCVLFLGGEWDAGALIQQLDQARSAGFKTALYTGLEFLEVAPEIMQRLDYLKYGAYVADRGPLSSPDTNQKIINLKTNENLNRYFIHGGSHDSIRHEASK